MYCVDILDALTKDFFARKGNAIEEAVEINEVQAAIDRPGYEPVSSTLWRQREEYCARLIQNAWRKHKTQKQGGNHQLSDVQEGGSKEEVNTDENFTSSVVAEKEGGHKVVIQSPHSKSPSIASLITIVLKITSLLNYINKSSINYCFIVEIIITNIHNKPNHIHTLWKIALFIYTVTCNLLK